MSEGKSSRDKKFKSENMTTLGYSLVCLSLTIFGAYYGALIVNTQTLGSFLSSVLAEPKKNLALSIGLLILTILFIDFFFRIRRCLGKNLSDEQRNSIESRAKFQNIIITAGVTALICFIFAEDFRYMVLFTLMAIIFVISTLFYIKALDRKYEATFKRMSYNIFYPSVLTIGLNMYLGMTIIQFNNISISDSTIPLFLGNIIPIFFFIGFFGLTAFFELRLYKLSDEKLNSKPPHKRSRDRFCFISCGLLCLAVIFCVVSSHIHNNVFLKVLHRSLLNMIASLLVSIFFSIFEGWDAIKTLDNETRNRNIKTLNIFMLFYPVILYTLCAIIPAKIFNHFFVIAFSIHTASCAVVWIFGNSGDSKEYVNTNWSCRKMWSGITAIIAMIISITVSTPNELVVLKSDRIAFISIILEFIMGHKVLKEARRTWESYDIFWNYCRNGKMFRIYSIISAFNSIIIYVFYIVFNALVVYFTETIRETRDDILMECVFFMAILGFVYFLFSIFTKNANNNMDIYISTER